MSISPSKARSLCTEQEYNLVKWSSPSNVKTLPPSKLKAKIDRARKLRDKFRDLAKKQRGEARGKRKPSGTRPAQGNERTVMKAELFDQTLDRFQKALEKAEAAEAKADKKKTSKKAASKKATSRKTTSEKTGSKTKTTKRLKQEAPPAQTTPAITLAAPGGRSLTSGISLGSAPASSLGSMFSASSAAGQQSRETRRREKSQGSKIGREDSRFARTSREKIQGHVSAQTRRSQAKRDSKGG